MYEEDVKRYTASKQELKGLGHIVFFLLVYLRKETCTLAHPIHSGKHIALFLQPLL